VCDELEVEGGWLKSEVPFVSCDDFGRDICHGKIMIMDRKRGDMDSSLVTVIFGKIK